MKVALCLSGHLRKFEQTAPTLHTYFLKNYDCDIFVHTWDHMGYGSNYRHDPNLSLTSNYLNQIHKLYNPKKIIIESSSFIDELKRQGDEYAPHLRNVPKHVGNMASMFYKIYACNELRKMYSLETGTEYDWIVRCRPDLKFHGNLDMPLTKQDGKIYLPHHRCGEGWLTDQIAIASPNDMDLYSSMFFLIPEYFRAKNEFYPEKFVAWCFKKLNINCELCAMHFDILR